MTAHDLEDFAAIRAHAAELVRRLAPQDQVRAEGVAVGFDDGEAEVVWQRR
jgi:hypothetical protein